MRHIRQIKTNEIKDMVHLRQNAYTALAKVNEEQVNKLIKSYEEQLETNEQLSFYGLFENDKLFGAMKLYDFKMNVFGQFLPLGGVGSVAVDLLHKKEKIAKDLISFYLSHYDQKGYSLGALYPFRPDFYYQMGFGYGAKKDQYKLTPSSFPNFNYKKDLTYLTKDDLQSMVQCYNDYAANHHGLITATDSHFDQHFESIQTKFVGVKKKNKLTGFAVFSFKQETEKNFLSNNIHIYKLVYTDRDALQQLSTFFHTQKDQVNRVIFSTQDQNFHHLFDDARDDSNTLIPSVFHQTNTSGIGLMYRVINVKRFFQQLSKHNFNGITHTVTFNIRDTFYEINNGPVTVTFTNGKPTVTKEAKPHTTIDIDIADFSSLVLGVVNFKKLHLFGKAEISDEEQITIIDEIFQSREKPICTSSF